MLDWESEHFSSSIVAVKSNSDLGGKLTIYAGGLGASFVQLSSLFGSHNVSLTLSFCCPLLSAGNIGLLIRFCISPRSEAMV